MSMRHLWCGPNRITEQHIDGQYIHDEVGRGQCQSAETKSREGDGAISRNVLSVCVSGKARPVQLEPNLRLAIVGFWEMLSYQVTAEGRRIV